MERKFIPQFPWIHNISELMMHKQSEKKIEFETLKNIKIRKNYLRLLCYLRVQRDNLLLFAARCQLWCGLKREKIFFWAVESNNTNVEWVVVCEISKRRRRKGGSFTAIKYGKFIQQATQISSSFQEVHL